MENEVEFHRYDPIIDDKTGYDLQWKYLKEI
jgi:hypothetical protein